MIVLRALVYAGYLYGLMAILGIALYPFAVVSPAAAKLGARTWSRSALWGLRTICGVRVVIEGREHIPTGAGLIAAKHQAMLDTIVPFTLLKDPAFVLKRELMRMPVYGAFAARGGHIAVDRDGHATALRAMMVAARAALAQGRQIVVFPEGTRKRPGDPPDYKPGVAALYRDLGASVTPVALNTGKCWPAKGFLIRPGVVTIQFLPPIPPGLPRAVFMNELQTRIETATAALG